MPASSLVILGKTVSLGLFLHVQNEEFGQVDLSDLVHFQPCVILSRRGLCQPETATTTPSSKLGTLKCHNVCRTVTASFLSLFCSWRAKFVALCLV